MRYHTLDGLTIVNCIAKRALMLTPTVCGSDSAEVLKWLRLVCDDAIKHMEEDMLECIVSKPARPKTLREMDLIPIFLKACRRRLRCGYSSVMVLARMTYTRNTRERAGVLKAAKIVVAVEAF